MSHDDLGDRMKSFYEDAYRISLPRRMPVIVRYDGKSFHSYTKKCTKPFDDNLSNVMNETASYVCKNVQGCKVAYIQSDEVSLLITNDDELNTQSYFDNNLQKIVSVIAGLASSYFTANSWKIWSKESSNGKFQDNRIFSEDIRPACFDARAFILPKEEVNNYFVFRQQDCVRNSVQMLARANFSHKQCENKNNSELQEMLFKKGINWSNCSTPQKRGRCIFKTKSSKEGFNPITNEKFIAERSEWIVDSNIPIFSQDKNYINKYILVQDKDV